MNNGLALLDPGPATKKPELNLSALEPGVPLRLRNVTWDDYLRFLDIIGNRHYRTSYANGEYEILMPTGLHEIWAEIISEFVKVLAHELKMQYKSAGMTTLRRDDVKKGLEPDRSYYLTNELLMRSKMTLDLSIDPPPDLALESEVTSSAEKRMPIYAALGVPEVWRIDSKGIAVHQLSATGQYVVAERSRYFPFLPMQELVRFLRRYGTVSEMELIDSFRDWVREQIAAGWPA